MPSYDLLVYHDFTDNLNDELKIGDDAGAKLGDKFAGLQVVATGIPIHPSKYATIVLAHSATPMEEIQTLLDRAASGEALPPASR